jgi:hypothetical protein
LIGYPQFAGDRPADSNQIPDGTCDSDIAHELSTFAGVPCSPIRYPYWLDDGYVEETFLFHNRAPLSPTAEAEMKRLRGIILDLKSRAAAQNPIRATGRKLISLVAQRFLRRWPRFCRDA